MVIRPTCKYFQVNQNLWQLPQFIRTKVEIDDKVVKQQLRVLYIIGTRLRHIKEVRRQS